MPSLATLKLIMGEYPVPASFAGTVGVASTSDLTV